MKLEIIEDLWLHVKTSLLDTQDVQKQGESLKIRKKMFAMLNKGRYIVKLPKERVTELRNSWEGQPYDPGNGKIMKEWVIIPIEISEKWVQIALEAREFALTLAK